ncbi:hypothetical protein [Alicyclobacillus sp.]|uniref:hypothetical protein n=1 Tax=Alicyclobacillus sp. TaxID=61169 RepID=UPI0025C67754|nr:hypothetical protein [Alicyclobacillus sp.]MCL6517921.1 hypothetical protein [Alicyclobacillus sp.]
MWKRMYELALRLLHQPVAIQHISGMVYHGILIRVSKKGMYLVPFDDPVPASGDPGAAVQTAEWTGPQAGDAVDARPVFFAPLFFPFAVVASFAAGSLLGAAASRPPYPPYPYYPPYGGYPYW